MLRFVATFLACLTLAFPATAQQADAPIQKLLQSQRDIIVESSRRTIGPAIDALANSGLPEGQKMQAFGLFSVTPIGLVLILTGIVYFLLLGRWVLPGGGKASISSVGGYGPSGCGKPVARVISTPPDMSPDRKAVLVPDHNSASLPRV